MYDTKYKTECETHYKEECYGYGYHKQCKKVPIEKCHDHPVQVCHRRCLAFNFLALPRVGNSTLRLA